MSRIAAGVQAIDLSRERGLEGDDSGSDAGGSGSDDEGSADGAGAMAEDPPQQGAEQQQEAEDDEGGWEVAAKSRDAARRQKRKVHVWHLTIFPRSMMQAKAALFPASPRRGPERLHAEAVGCETTPLSCMRSSIESKTPEYTSLDAALMSQLSAALLERRRIGGISSA